MSSYCITCVDISGSMSGKRLEQAKNIVETIEQGSNQAHGYYYFNTELYKTTKSDFHKLLSDGGTSIEYVLNKMCDNELTMYTNYLTRFTFITDAEDMIRKKDELCTKLSSLKKKFGKGLYLKLVLINNDGSGGCVKELKYIFGNDMYQVNDKDFEKLAKSLAEANNLAAKTQNEINNSSAILQNLNLNSENEIKKTRERIEQLNQKVEKFANQVSECETIMTQARNEYNNLENQYGDKIQDAQNAVTQEQLDNAEESITEMQNQYTMIKVEISRAKTKANEAEIELLKRQKDITDLSNKCQKEDEELKKKLGNTRNNIKSLLKKIRDLKSLDPKNTEAKELRKNIKKIVNNSKKLVENQEKKFKMIDNIQKEFIALLKQTTNAGTNHDELKKKIEEKLEELDGVLEDIYDRQD